MITRNTDYTDFKKQITQIGLVIMLATGMSVMVFAEEEKEKPRTTSAMYEVEGEISAITKDYIAVVYKRDETKGVEYEILLPIEKDIQLAHKRNLDQLNVGDIVRIQYEEVTEEYKEGPKQSRKAKVISFVKPAERKPETAEPQAVETLPIKGLKGQ